MRTSVVVGTAGHIDHGKSAIVKALTGTDPDRLKEEQARGITIDLGFAHLEVGDAAVAFVDVPGHERFVRNMLAGAGGIDAVVLVVAADDGVKPQTREHFDICRLLGIDRGIIALSKIDLADEEMRELASQDARELVAGSFLQDAPIIPVSARTGEGLTALSAALASLAGAAPRQARAGVVRLPVDRVFTVKGFGAVVTGTLVSGRIAEGDELVALPDGRDVRVRGVQIHNRAAAEALAPRRVAVNLGGVDARELARGVTIASPGTVAVTRRIDVKLTLLDGARPLRHGARVRVHHGTTEIAGRVSLAATRPRGASSWTPVRAADAGVALDAAGEAYARIRLEQPAVLTRGDRIVLRAYSPPVTTGGGLVLDPEAPSGGVRRSGSLDRFSALSRSAHDAARVWLADAAGRGLDHDALVRRGGLDPVAARAVADDLVQAGSAVRAGSALFDAALAADIERTLRSVVSDYHRQHPLEPGMSREAVRERVAAAVAPDLFDAVVGQMTSARVVTGTDRLALALHRPALSADEARARDVLLREIEAAGLTPPDPASLAAAAGVTPSVVERVVHKLVRDRELAKVDAWVFHPAALSRLKAEVQALRSAAPPGAPATVDVATFKAKFGLSRKFAIPLLEWLDRERVTRRVGETRIVIG